MPLTASSVAPAPRQVSPLDAAWAAHTVRRVLDEDLGNESPSDPGRDVTGQATLARADACQARLVAREPGVVAGLVLVGEVFDQVSRRFGLPPVDIRWQYRDGDQVAKGTVLADLSGPAQVMLAAERSVLNLASRASGVASATRAWADVLATVVRPDGSRAVVLDTRKTTPGLRALDKYAVRCGGGRNKRFGLYDVAMIKDNHVAAAGSVTAAVHRVREHDASIEVQVEADTLDQALEAISAGARFLLLDNMRDGELAATVRAVRDREATLGEHVALEATGNLSLDRAAAVAATGVDFLSVGALTHSAPILDLALDLLGQAGPGF